MNFRYRLEMDTSIFVFVVDDGDDGNVNDDDDIHILHWKEVYCKHNSWKIRYIEVLEVHTVSS
jgi:hypothetical protein